MPYTYIDCNMSWENTRFHTIYTHTHKIKSMNRTCRMYSATDDDVDDADDMTGLLSHPTTNRNVYLTRRKLAPRCMCERRRRGCAHFPFTFSELFLHPLRSRALVFFSAAVMPVINFAEFGSTHRMREAHVRNRQLTSGVESLYNLVISLMKYCNITEFCHKRVSEYPQCRSFQPKFFTNTH